MLELKITAKLLNSAEKDIIGIKEVLASTIEKWADVISIDVTTSEPLQLTLEDKPQIRPKVTMQTALSEITKQNLTLEEMQNIVSALIELTKIEGVERIENSAVDS